MDDLIAKKIWESHDGGDIFTTEFLYYSFIEQVRERGEVDGSLANFVADRLEEAMKSASGSDRKLHVFQAMRLQGKKGKTQSIDGETVPHSHYQFRVVSSFLNLMEKHQIEQPWNVRNDVGEDFKIAGDTAYRIYADAEKSGVVEQVRAIRAEIDRDKALD